MSIFRATRLTFLSDAGDWGKLPGIISTVVGYTGGKEPNPTYRNIKDHTEALQVEFDPAVLPYSTVVSKFFQQHDWRRACSSSRQYRTCIWYHDDGQREAIQAHVKTLGTGVATSVEASTAFYDAEEYHQKYLEKNK